MCQGSLLVLNQLAQIAGIYLTETTQIGEVKSELLQVHVSVN